MGGIPISSEEATGREELEQKRKELEEIRAKCGAEIREVLIKYNCHLTATVLITPKGNEPNVLLLNNELKE